MDSLNAKRILCYGDSNTWGYQPVTARRYDENTRWTGVAQTLLSDEYRIIEAGLSGRTTIFDDPFDPYRNGLSGLGYALLEAAPVDLVVLSLGTNDLKFTNITGAARGIIALVSAIRQISTQTPTDCLYSAVTQPPAATKPPEILIISPILIHPGIESINPQTSFAGGYEKSLQFAAAFQHTAEVMDTHFLDAAQVAAPSDADGVHMTVEGHTALGRAVAQKIREIFGSV